MRNPIVITGVVFFAVLAAAAWGEAGTGIRSGPFTLSPVVEVAAVYDSNIDRLSTDEEDATFFDAELSLSLGYRAREVEFSGTGFLGQRFYTEDGDRDFSTGGEILSLQYGSRDRIAIAVQQSYRKVEDLDTFGPDAEVGGMAPDAFLDADVRRRREILEAGATVEATPTDKLDVSAGYRYSETDYSSTNLFDLDGHGAQLEAGHRLTDKVAALVTVMGGIQESEDVDDSSQYTAARLGLRMRGTDRLNYKAGIGYQNLDRPEGLDSEDGFHYDALASWAATDKTAVQLEGRNGMQLSSIHLGNAVDYSVARLGVSYRMSSSMALTASGVYRIDDYADRVLNEGELVHRKDKGATLKLRADYKLPAKYLLLFVEGSYENVDSTIRDYEVTRVSLGVDVEI
ncbi:MAG: outer membrane beta-barrel protein [Kiritimatiellae bacterium]|nr:outer membrane beta-barrel protein [Kiritimatiellia bacterium]